MIDNKEFTSFGKGRAGGKAEGLRKLMKLSSLTTRNCFSTIETNVPPFTVIQTEYFDRFLEENDLRSIAFSELPDERKARKFIDSELPCELSGYLWKLTEQSSFPIAVRSSSMLEDMKDNPLAGIYATQMVPNNQLNISERFRSITDAVKLIYASTFSKRAISYMKANNLDPEQEKMAIIIQKVAGKEKNSSYYPDISGVAKSWNYYPAADSSPSEGIIQLAIGLGKSVVSGESIWFFSPDAPCKPPPFNSVKDLMNNTQKKFWAINMKPQTEYIPFKEDSFLINKTLQEAEYDNRIKYSASTWVPSSDTIQPGTGTPGARIINFKPILDTGLIPLNDALTELIKSSEKLLEEKVEIEFAVTIDYDTKHHELSLLQVRPMREENDSYTVNLDLTPQSKLLLSSAATLGNGCINSLQYITYLKPEEFDFKYSRQILTELEKINHKLVQQNKQYILIGFGRWGSSDPWLGLPADWEHISGAKTIVEIKHDKRPTEFSQGSHFFHNLTNLRIVYFSIDHTDRFPINWEWLESQNVVIETDFVKAIKTTAPVEVKVDGKRREGAILIA